MSAARDPAARDLFGLFGALQAFYLFGTRQRFSVLFWADWEAWPAVALLWLEGLLLAGAAFLLFRWVFSRTEAASAGTPSAPSRLHWLAAAAVAVAGTALRFSFAADVPPGSWCDVFYEIEPVLRSPVPPSWIGGTVYAGASEGTRVMVSNLYLLFARAVLALFGRSQEGIAAISLLPSALTLPAVFWLGLETSGPRVALVALTLTAFSRWPLVFSGWTWTGALLLPLALSAGAAAARAYRLRSVSWAAASGLLLGLALHTHPSAWSIAGGFALFALLSVRATGPLVPAVALGAALAALAPFAAAYRTHPDRLGGRALDVGVASRVQDASAPQAGGRLGVGARLLYNFFEYTGCLLFTSDPNPRHGLPGRSAVTPLVGFAALTGLALSLRRAARGSAPDRLLLCIALGSLLAGVLSNPGGAPNTFRTIVLMGPVFLAAAVSLVGWFDLTLAKRGARPAAVAGLGVALLLSTETSDALVKWPALPIVRRAFCPDESVLGPLRASLADGPTLLEPGALPHPVVFETLSSPADPAVVVRRLPRESSGTLLIAPPRSPFWYVANEDALARLRRAGWRVGRGIGARIPSQGGPVIARVVPPPAAGR